MTTRTARTLGRILTLPAPSRGQFGPDHTVIEAIHPSVGQIGWLDRTDGDGETELSIANRGPRPLRLLFYSGQRQNTPIAWHGPFIGDTRSDLARSYERYRAGTFQRI